MTCTTSAPCIIAYDGEIAARVAECAALLAALDSNGTKTSLLLARIADTTYSNSTLTSELLQWSLLIDTVLKAVCVRHPFFHEDQFLNIMLHNSPVNREVWPYVAEAFSNIKEEFGDSITAAQATDTLRTLHVIEREKEMAETERFLVITAHLQSLIDHDSVPDSTFMMVQWLADSISGKQWKQLAVGTALSLDTLTWARALLDSLDMENAEDTAFYDLHDLAITLREDTLTWLDMSIGQKTVIEELADGETGMKGHAEVILALVNDTVLWREPEPFELPSMRLGEEEEIEEEDTGRIATESVTVYPNPFSNSFNITYVLEKEAEEFHVELFDLMGRNVRSIHYQGVTSGQLTVDLGECLGIYMLRIIADNKRIHQQKVVCLSP